jgi:hypothetical protein
MKKQNTRLTTICQYVNYLEVWLLRWARTFSPRVPRLAACPGQVLKHPLLAWESLENRHESTPRRH